VRYPGVHLVERGPITPAKNLIIGLRYRVGGILHEYLGEALLPDESGVAHVFLRNEWRPNTAQQLPLTLIREDDVELTVERTRIGGPGAHSHRRMWPRWE